MWSFDTIIMDTDSHKIFDDSGESISHNCEVIFGDNVWLGCRCVVLKGANIPNGSIIAANSTVTKKLVKKGQFTKEIQSTEITSGGQLR